MLTDSLGMPRVNIGIDDVWTDKILSRYHDQYVIYTCLEKSLSVKDIWDRAYDLFILDKPNVAVIQVGVCDASRRALPLAVIRTLKYFPRVGGVVHRFANKHHYRLSQLFNWHYASPAEFEWHIRTFVGMLRDHGCQDFAMIRIGPVGGHMAEVTFHVSADVARYNGILQRLSQELGFTLLDPYGSLSAKDPDFDDYILPDGHHLTAKGNGVVFDCVDKYLAQLDPGPVA